MARISAPTERFLWRAPFWSVDLAFVPMPFALVVPLIARRMDGKPLPSAEIVFSAFALVFAALLLCAHLRPRYALTLDDEGVRAEKPGALIGRHPWRLAWGEIRRVVIVSGPDHRTLTFEPKTPGSYTAYYVAILFGLGSKPEDEPALLAALARRGLPVVETPPPVSVTVGREFVLRTSRDGLSRLILGAGAIMLLWLPIRGFLDFMKEDGPIRFLWLAFGIGFLAVAILTVRKARGTRWLLLVGDEGVAYVERSPGRPGKPPTEQVQWALPWRDVVRIEREPDVLIFQTELAPRAVPFGSAPKAGLADPEGLLALLVARDFAIERRR